MAEDSKSCNSLQNQSTGSKTPGFSLKPSILTQKAEAMRTDKASVNSMSVEKPKFSLLDSNDPFTRKLADGNTNDANSTSVSGFIFGQNIMSRTTGLQEFKDLAKVPNTNDEENENEVGSEVLRKNAEEVQKQNILPQLGETEVVTGEENEKNILKLSCKLFQFNSDKQEWISKGPCNVHLNDMISDEDKDKCARLVIRSKGGLQVIVNTFIWADMSVARASDKSIRLSAQCASGAGGVKSFLVTLPNVQDADTLYESLLKRKNQLNNIDKNSCRKRPAENSLQNTEEGDLKEKSIEEPVAKKSL